MSLIGLVNLTERLLNQSRDDGDDGGTSQKPNKSVAQRSVNASGNDEFRPSRGDAESEAGLFQVKQQSVFTAAATVLLVENNPAQSAPLPTSGSAVTSATTKNAPAPAVISANPAQQAAAATTSSTAPTTNTDALAQLQTLNSSLAALGLDQSEIDVIDRVAQLIRDFSPAAFTSLVNQLQILQQDTSQNTAQDTTTNTATAGAANTQTSGGFTLEAISIQFAGVNETLQQGGNGNRAGGETLQVSAFQLQVSEVQLTLNSKSTGQPAQIRAPQATTLAAKAAAA